MCLGSSVWVKLFTDLEVNSIYFSTLKANANSFPVTSETYFFHKEFFKTPSKVTSLSFLIS